MNEMIQWGTLPTREQFDRAFEVEFPRGFRISSCDSRAFEGFKIREGIWSVGKLWEAITEIVSAEGEVITLAKDDESQKNVYLVVYPDRDWPPVEIGPDPGELIPWANRFGGGIVTETGAVECLDDALEYGQTGYDWTRFEERMALVASILEALHFEWISPRHFVGNL